MYVLVHGQGRCNLIFTFFYSLFLFLSLLLLFVVFFACTTSLWLSLVTINFCVIAEAFVPVKVPRAEVTPIIREIPPSTGFGSDEDSMASVQKLLPKQPRK